VGSREATELSYVYAVALHSAGRKNEAMETLEAVLAKHPDNRNVLLALMTFSRDAGQLTVALAYQLAKITPNDSSLAAFIQELKQKLDGSGIPRSPMSAVGPSRQFVATQQFGRLRSEADIQRATLIEPDL